MNHPEAMHILQAIRNIRQLPNELVRRLPRSNIDTYKRSPVCIRIIPNELVDIPIVHPLRNHRKVALIERHSKQRQNVWVPKVLANHCLSAKSLWCIHRCK